MSPEWLRVARYRSAATIRSRRSGLVALVLLVALVGGLAMGALAAARRTQASFATYVASTNPSDLQITDFGGAQNGGGTIDVSPSGFQRVAHLPGVVHMASAFPFAGLPLRRDGSAIADTATLSNTFPLASLGLFFTQDRATVLQGRMANPARQDEMVMTPDAAQVLGDHLGEVVPYGIFTPTQEMMPGFGTPSVRPVRVVDAKLVGIVQYSSAVVQDDIDHYPTFVVFTPALAHSILAHNAQSVSAVSYALQLRDGDAGAGPVEAAFPRLLPPGTGYEFHAAAPVAEKVETSVKPISVALGVFGGIAALAAILIALQVIARQLQAAEADLDTLRALGAPPAAIVADTLIGLFVAVVLGALGAAVVAVALSPLAPLGPVRVVYPGSALAFDWTVLGLGVLGLVIVLGAIAGALAYRRSPHRLARRQRQSTARTSRILSATSATGIPASGVVGMRFALEPGRGRTAVPVRSALLGSTLAITLVVATLTFGSGLQSLVSHPALFGWNWTYLLNPTNAVPPQVEGLLNHDSSVAAWAPYDYNDVEVDGQNVPMLFERTQRPPISPPIVSGHDVMSSHQIVLGSSTMASLHAHLGSTVTLTFGSAADAPYYLPPTGFVVVGTATMPAVGFASIVSDHTSMGTGGLINESGLPASLVNAVYTGGSGPALVFVRMRAGVSAAAGRANLETVARALNRDLAALNPGAGNSVAVLGVQRPAQIVNYRTIGSTPGILASALVAGAVAALTLTLVTSVRRRRRDLALLKTLGFTQRQLAGAIAWQASVIGVIGVAIGIPLGIALGRWLWTLFAQLIYAVPKSSVPVSQVVLVGVGALVVANVVAALPGRSAGRTPTAVLLHSE